MRVGKNSQDMPTDGAAYASASTAGREPIALVQPMSRMTCRGFLYIWIGFHVSRRAIKQSFCACAINAVGVELQSFSGMRSTAVVVEKSSLLIFPVLVSGSAVDRGLAVVTAESERWLLLFFLSGQLAAAAAAAGVAQLNVVCSATRAFLFFSF